MVHTLSHEPCHLTPASWSLSPVSWLLLFVLLLLPIFAHGCHGDDVDHEPSAARQDDD